MRQHTAIGYTLVMAVLGLADGRASTVENAPVSLY
jgi:hypothetical protein